MIKHYITIAWRNLRKHRIYSFISIGGLALGLSAFWLITLFIVDDLSYDRYHPDADRIFRAVSHANWDGGKFGIAATPTPLGPELMASYPEVQAATRIDGEGGGVLNFGDKHFKEDAICFADSTFFQIFSHQFLYGDKNTALKSPQSIVVTETLAKKLFGDPAEALNKTVKFENDYPNLVTGVIADVPHNSHITFKALRSYPKNFKEDWAQLHSVTYFKLKQGADIKKLEAAMPLLIARSIKPDLSKQFKKLEFKLEFQPLTSIHLHSRLDYDYGEKGNMIYIYVFSIIGLLVLLVAVINYINLSTARASIRIKEVGIRRVNGSSKAELIKLFLTESVLITILATVISCIIIVAVLPWYNVLAGKDIGLWYFRPIPTLFIVLASSLITGLLSGIYPALLLSGFRLIPALKGETGKRSGEGAFRKGLVVFQFIVTICMISCTLVIYQQLSHVLKKDLGFNKEQVLVFHLEGDKIRQDIAALKRELLRSPLVESVSAAGIRIGNQMGRTSYQTKTEGAGVSANSFTNFLTIDEDYLSTLQLKLADGRNFSSQYPTDKGGAVIINESLVKETGMKDPVGKSIIVDETPLTIIGVAKDFHFLSLQYKIEPLVMTLPTSVSENDNFYVRVTKKNVTDAVKYVEQTYSKFDNSSPFSYDFLDQRFAEQYAAEQRQGKLLLVFTVLSILLACMGLFGLVTFTVEQRVKEIGIRRVLGASITHVVKLISRDFVKQVSFAAIIAAPLAWWLMNNWLQDFAYRIDLSGWVFLLASVVALSIAIITVSIQSLKAATSNPSKTLKTE